MNSKPLTARGITIMLYWKLRSSSDLLLPRYTPKDWWECDLWRLTRAGFVDEYEIKLSVSDFNADAAKVQESRYQYNAEEHRMLPTVRRVKHDILKGSDDGPNRFWYVLPVELVERVTIPDYAGLITVREHGALEEKQAPKRHSVKWSGDRARILETFYHRYWTHETRTNKSQPVEISE